MTTSAQESTSAHFYTEKKEGHGQDDSRYCNKNKHKLRKKYNCHTIKMNNEQWKISEQSIWIVWNNRSRTRAS